VARNRRYLPILLDATDKKIVLIGGGGACAEKLRTLAQLRMKITAISPEFGEAFNREWIERVHRKYEPGDLKGCSLAYVGINDPGEEMRILEEARREHVLVNFVDQVSKSDFISPAALIRKHFAIFISTFGRGPGATKRIRKTIEERIDLEGLDQFVGRYIEERERGRGAE
jgi:siroheme synthase-like protein